MADDVTPGELDRRLRDHEARTDRIHGEQDTRIARVAADSVPMDVYAADQRARIEEARRLERDHIEDMRKLREDVIRPLERRMETQEARPQMTFTNKIALYGLIVAFIAVVIAAWVATKGAS